MFHWVIHHNSTFVQPYIPNRAQAALLGCDPSHTVDKTLAPFSSSVIIAFTINFWSCAPDAAFLDANTAIGGIHFSLYGRKIRTNGSSANSGILIDSCCSSFSSLSSCHYLFNADKLSVSASHCSSLSYRYVNPLYLCKSWIMDISSHMREPNLPERGLFLKFFLIHSNAKSLKPNSDDKLLESFLWVSLYGSGRIVYSKMLICSWALHPDQHTF